MDLFADGIRDLLPTLVSWLSIHDQMRLMLTCHALYASNFVNATKRIVMQKFAVPGFVGGAPIGNMYEVANRVLVALGYEAMPSQDDALNMRTALARTGQNPGVRIGHAAPADAGPGDYFGTDFLHGVLVPPRDYAVEFGFGASETLLNPHLPPARAKAYDHGMRYLLEASLPAYDEWLWIDFGSYPAMYRPILYRTDFKFTRALPSAVWYVGSFLAPESIWADMPETTDWHGLHFVHADHCGPPVPH